MPTRCLVLCCWLAALLVSVAGCAAAPTDSARVGVVDAMRYRSEAGFARATEPRTFQFPQDHGPHPAYQTEWWYYTGNLTATDAGDAGPDERHFGFHLTFFRNGLTPADPARQSDWATTEFYMAHLALTDVAGGEFYHFERFSRSAAGLAGASANPFRVFVEDWSASSTSPAALPMQLRAAAGEIALNLSLESAKPPVLQGEQGLSQKGATVGNASYYYSLTRMPTSGTVRVQGQTYRVQGLSWMDREFSTSGLEAGAEGWDWFSLQLDNQYELMVYVIRNEDRAQAVFFGTLVAPDGSATRLAAADLTLETRATWRSPHTGAVYPARWRLSIPSQRLELEITPHMADQEMLTTVTYWEGAVRIDGSHQGQPVEGNGYVELTGYADPAG